MSKPKLGRSGGKWLSPSGVVYYVVFFVESCLGIGQSNVVEVEAKAQFGIASTYFPIIQCFFVVSYVAANEQCSLTEQGQYAFKMQVADWRYVNQIIFLLLGAAGILAYLILTCFATSLEIFSGDIVGRCEQEG